MVRKWKDRQPILNMCSQELLFFLPSPPHSSQNDQTTQLTETTVKIVLTTPAPMVAQIGSLTPASLKIPVEQQNTQEKTQEDATSKEQLCMAAKQNCRKITSKPQEVRSPFQVFFVVVQSQYLFCKLIIFCILSLFSS